MPCVCSRDRYPQCVLINKAQLVAAPFVVNVSQPALPLAAASLVPQPPPSPPPSPPPAKGVSLTPPMGFNSWNFYHCNIDERAIKQIALALKSSGLAAKGCVLPYTVPA